MNVVIFNIKTKIMILQKGFMHRSGCFKLTNLLGIKSLLKVASPYTDYAVYHGISTY